MNTSEKAGKGQTNRQRIIEAADRLFYEKGYNQTSFTEIAEAADFPRGNFYYYFRSKEDLLKEVIHFRCERLRGMVRDWTEQHPDPCERLQLLPEILEWHRDDFVRYGCPIGTITVELGKSQAELQQAAKEMMAILIDWCSEQLERLGYGEQSKTVAMHLMSRSQGITTVAYAYHDPEYADFEIQKFRGEIRQLCSR